MGEFVLKGDSVVEIGSSACTEKRDWVYSINYRKIDKEKLSISSGGSSCWWGESHFKKLDDPLLKLIIKKQKLDDDQRKKEHELDVIQKNQDKIRYALKVVQGVQP